MTSADVDVLMVPTVSTPGETSLSGWEIAEHKQPHIQRKHPTLYMYNSCYPVDSNFGIFRRSSHSLLFDATLHYSLTSLVACAMDQDHQSVGTALRDTLGTKREPVKVRLIAQYSHMIITWPLSPDVDECEVESLCSSGTYCENTAGSHDCKGRHMMH